MLILSVKEGIDAGKFLNVRGSLKNKSVGLQYLIVAPDDSFDGVPRKISVP